MSSVSRFEILIPGPPGTGGITLATANASYAAKAATEAAIARVDPGSAGADGAVLHYRGGAPMVGHLPFVSAELDYGIGPDDVTDQTSTINTMIEEVSAAGGGVIGLRKGTYRGHLVLKTGITLTGFSPQFGYSGGSSPVMGVRIKGLGSSWVIDTPITQIRNAALAGLNIVGVSRETAGGGVRIQDGAMVSIKNVHLSDYQDQAILFNVANVCTLEDILAFGALSNRTRSAANGVIELVSGADNFLHRIEANASSTALSDANMLVNAIVLGVWNTMATSCVGEISDRGWVVSGSANRFANCRGDLNFAQDWHLSGSSNMLSTCLAMNGGQAATATYPGFRITGQENTFSACITKQVSTGRTYSYGFHDSFAHGSPTNRNKYAACSPESFAVAPYSMDGYLGSSPHIPNNPIRPASGTTSVVVGGAGLVVFQGYGTPTTVTSFTGGVVGQELTIIGDADVTIENNATIKTSTGANLALANNRAYKFTNYNGVWYQI